MNELAFLTGAADELTQQRFSYAVVRQHEHHQSGLLIDTDGKIFQFACDDLPALSLQPGVCISQQQWCAVVQSQQALLEQTSANELTRLWRANEVVSNETLTPVSVGEADGDDYFLVSVAARNENPEPVILWQDGAWRRDNEADEARILKAFLVNKARLYDV